MTAARPPQRDRYAQCDDTCTVDCGACKGRPPHANVTDRTTAPTAVFEARVAAIEAAEADPDGTVERVGRAIFGFMPPISYNLRLAMARDAARAAIAALRGPAPADDPAAAVEAERAQIAQGVCPRSGERILRGGAMRPACAFCECGEPS